jgi:hypothetical protein
MNVSPSNRSKRKVLELVGQLNQIIHNRNLYRNGHRVMNARAQLVVEAEDPGGSRDRYYVIVVEDVQWGTDFTLVQSDRLTDGNGHEVLLWSRRMSAR